MFKKILVCCDGSRNCTCAAEYALDLAAEQHAEVDILSIIEPLPSYLASAKEIEDECCYEGECLKDKQERLLARARDLGVHAEATILKGSAPDLIVEVARHGGADLIVLGPHTQRSLWVHQAVHTADKILEGAPCSVLVMR